MPGKTALYRRGASPTSSRRECLRLCRSRKPAALRQSLLDHSRSSLPRRSHRVRVCAQSASKQKMFDLSAQSLRWLFSQLGKTNRRGSPAHEPQWSNDEINWVFKECRLISFDRVSYELQNPTDNEKRQRPAPVEQEERQ